MFSFDLTKTSSQQTVCVIEIPDMDCKPTSESDSSIQIESLVTSSFIQCNECFFY
ncbi:hypothetical protein PROFUN_04085 [Planoprotostelium fungivorum]|uniref:Uncharacterized protein n=1 Tax=Planoprotostelium fungivorum TaxID=1890364 RepID=A0A2P6NJH8_9EUKA|nr:hypothetical protein PROFUN_04085 [Planoprotostelium fungivorum]